MTLMIATLVLGVLTYLILKPNEIVVKKKRFKDYVFELPELSGVSKDYIKTLIKHSKNLNQLKPIELYLYNKQKVSNLTKGELRALRQLLKEKEDELFYDWFQKDNVE